MNNSSTANPFFKLLLDKKMQQTVSSVRRLNDEGTLYYMDCTEKYDRTLFKAVFKLMGKIKYTGCSAFIAENPTGGYSVGRNYDLPHKDKNGNITGLNLVVHVPARDGHYASLACADACWFTYLKLNYVAGALDDGSTNLSPLVLMPYFCMDGINEKGVTATILALHTKEGETPADQKIKGKKSIVITVLLREILDNCKSVDEAIALSQRYNMKALLGLDYHLFVTDASGRSAVIDWRFNELHANFTDACTNFYVGYSDAADIYVHGILKENFPGPAVTQKEYRYGFGHGYERFNTVVTAMDKVRKDCRVVMDKGEMKAVLDSVRQQYTNEISSHTQYCVVYNSEEPGLTVWPLPGYDKPYEFTF